MNNEIFKMVRNDLLTSAKRMVDTAPDTDVGKERIVQVITALLEVLAILSVPYPADAKVAIINGLMNLMEEKLAKFEELVAREEAAAAIDRAKA